MNNFSSSFHMELQFNIYKDTGKESFFLNKDGFRVVNMLNR